MVVARWHLRGVGSGGDGSRPAMLRVLGRGIAWDELLGSGLGMLISNLLNQGRGPQTFTGFCLRKPSEARYDQRLSQGEREILNGLFSFYYC